MTAPEITVNPNYPRHKVKHVNLMVDTYLANATLEEDVGNGEITPTRTLREVIARARTVYGALPPYLVQGNFISYAWAPVSIVAPLGTFALVANCLFSPLIQGERFRKRDIFGITIAIIGAVTVVLSSNASNGRLNPAALVRAISQTPFIVYTCIHAVGAMILASLSQSSYGQRYALIGLCALFGGFTVLSTKAVSTLLTMKWSQVFTSRSLVPLLVLYGDFKKASFHQIVTFLYGCAATFAGVFIIAWSSESNESEFEHRGTEQSNHGNFDGAASIRAEQVGSLGRRRATLVLPDGISDLPSLHHKHSGISVMGLSPAQPLLLVHTPPREHPMRDFERDGSTPSSYQRQRAISWFGDDSSPRGRMYEGGRRTRDSSLAARLRSSAGASSVSQAPSHLPNR
ncbi:magnesium transporter NIPA-domain-containing protein [Lentinula aff. detonsa]|nr:magnesium transporter NIPA-domain-containing protein [Lentinula aff. detonsa]